MMGRTAASASTSMSDQVLRCSQGRLQGSPLWRQTQVQGKLWQLEGRVAMDTGQKTWERWGLGVLTEVARCQKGGEVVDRVGVAWLGSTLRLCQRKRHGCGAARRVSIGRRRVPCGGQGRGEVMAGRGGRPCCRKVEALGVGLLTSGLGRSQPGKQRRSASRSDVVGFGFGKRGPGTASSCLASRFPGDGVEQRPDVDRRRGSVQVGARPAERVLRRAGRRSSVLEVALHGVLEGDVRWWPRLERWRRVRVTKRYRAAEPRNEARPPCRSGTRHDGGHRQG